MQVPTGFKAAQNAVHTPGSFYRPEFLNKGAEPQTVKQCALHAVAALLIRESGALHGARANAGFDVHLEDFVCLGGVSGILQVGAGAAPSRCVARDSDQTAGVDGDFCETDRLYEVAETTAACSFAAATERLHAECTRLASCWSLCLAKQSWWAALEVASA